MLADTPTWGSEGGHLGWQEVALCDSAVVKVLYADVSKCTPAPACAPNRNKMPARAAAVKSMELRWSICEGWCEPVSE